VDLPAAISAALSVAAAVLAAAVALAGPARLARSVAVDGPRAAAAGRWARRDRQDVVWERAEVPAAGVTAAAAVARRAAGNARCRTKANRGRTSPAAVVVETTGHPVD